LASDFFLSGESAFSFKVWVLILERLLAGLKDAFTAFPDKRKGEGVYSMADIGLSALSLFFTQSESFLSYQRSLEEGRKTSNCHTLFGMAKIPTDNHIRSMLDPVHPSHLQSSFDQTIAELLGKGGMKSFQRLDGRALIALDGTDFLVRKSSAARIARRASAPTARSRAIIPCWRRPSWRPATTWPCR
jgi:hypothetical protein